MDDDDVITRLRNNLSPNVLARLTMSQAKTPMLFLSDMQKVSDSLRLEARNGNLQRKRELCTERKLWRAGPKANHQGSTWRPRRWQRKRSDVARTKAPIGPEPFDRKERKQGTGTRPSGKLPIERYKCGGPHLARNCLETGSSTGTQKKPPVAQEKTNDRGLDRRSSSEWWTVKPDTSGDYYNA